MEVKKTAKRENYISWDEYFMGIAMFSAERSKDPNTDVGACIVSEDNRILSMGYNGAPRGLHDDEMRWSREGSFIDTKSLYILNKFSPVNPTLIFETFIACPCPLFTLLISVIFFYIFDT